MHLVCLSQLDVTSATEDLAVAGGDASRSVCHNWMLRLQTLISVQSRLEGDTAELDLVMCTSPAFCTQNGLGPGKARTVKKGRKMFLDRCEYFMGTTSGSDVSNRIDFDGRST